MLCTTKEFLKHQKRTKCCFAIFLRNDKLDNWIPLRYQCMSNSLLTNFKKVILEEISNGLPHMYEHFK